MFIYDRWDEHLFDQMMRRSTDMRRAMTDNAAKIGGETVAEEILKGSFMGLWKRELVEDTDPREHLPSEAGVRLLAKVFADRGWVELRQACRHDKFRSSVAAASILDTITQIVKEDEQDQRNERDGFPGGGGGGAGARPSRRRKGQPTNTPNRSNKGIDTLDAIDKAEAAREDAADDQEELDILDEMAESAETARERNSIEAAKRKRQAHKEMSEKKAEEAEAEGKEALDRVERAVEHKISGKLREAAQHVKEVGDSIDQLHEAGLIDEDSDDMVGDDLEWDEDEDGDEWSDDELNDLTGGGASKMSAKEREALKHMSADAIKRVKMASDVLKATAGLAKLAEEIGRIKAVFRSSMKPTPIAGNPGGIEGVTYGNKIPDQTSMAMAQMLHPRLRRIWRINFAEEALTQREMWGPDLAGRGPIVCVVDASSSMGGQKYFWAKALALALLSVAKEQDRDFCWIAFNEGVTQKIVIPKGRADVSTLVEIERHKADGNTAFDPWMHAAVEVIEQRKEFSKADVVVISDGEPYEKPGYETDEYIAKQVRDHRESRAYAVTAGWRSQAEVDAECERIRNKYSTFRWWAEQRARLGFRVRGVFIGDEHHDPAGTEPALAAAERKLITTRTEVARHPTWYQGQEKNAEGYVNAIKAEIKAGMTVDAPITPEAVKAAMAWHQAEIDRLDEQTQQPLRYGHQMRRRWLEEITGPAAVMQATCDTWSDVSKIADHAATEAVEAEIARMVE